MAREKKPVHKVQMTEGKRNIIHQLLEEYDIQSAEDIQEALCKFQINGAPFSRQRCKRLAPAVRCPFIAWRPFQVLCKR